MPAIAEPACGQAGELCARLLFAALKLFEPILSCTLSFYSLWGSQTGGSAGISKRPHLPTPSKNISSKGRTMQGRKVPSVSLHPGSNGLRRN